MHSQSDNKEIKINEKADEVIEKLYKFLLSRYQNNLETSMRGSVLSLIGYMYCTINVIK